MCRLQGGIKTTRLHDLINHNTSLSDNVTKLFSDVLDALKM